MRAALVAALVVGCAASARPAVPPAPLPVSPAGIDRAVIAKDLDRIEALADRACACEDDDCFDAVDTDLVTLAQTETENDPITDVETWPRDLDDLAHAANHRLLACYLEQHHSSAKLFGALVRRRAESLRTAACACTTATCANRAAALVRERSIALTPYPPEDQRAITAAQAETLRCAAQIAGEQSLLDLKSIRKDACACTDAACAADIAAQVKTWGDDNAHTPADQATIRELRDVATAIAQCLTAARGR
jgi:hypothetical protein